MLLKLEKITDKIIDFVGYLTGILLLLMILNVAYDVVAVQMFKAKIVATQEFEWHLFAVIMLFGTGYTLKHNAHVRVDFVYDNLSLKKKAWINILGTILFILPLALLVIYGSYEYVLDSYNTNEVSDNSDGLPYRWIIKAMIPLSFIFLIFCAFNFLLHNINVLKGLEKPLPIEEDEL